MAATKEPFGWIVSVIAFVLLVLLASTGLINWVLLPRGGTATGGLLLGLRHGLRAIHQFSAVLFAAAVGVHLWLHWGYIKARLKQMPGKRDSPPGAAKTS
jgi:membrane protein implicated in regulation of membrane protease activity